MVSELFQRYRFLKKIAELDGVDQIWLYGSRAREDNWNRSDIDIAIVCPNISKDNWFKVGKIIEDADTLLGIDCVRFDTLPEGIFKSNILKDKIVLFKRGSNE